MYQIERVANSYYGLTVESIYFVFGDLQKEEFLGGLLKQHSMAVGNLNKTRETMQTTIKALMVAPLRTIIHKK